MKELTKKLNQDLEIIYLRVTDLWQRLCEEHSLLLDLTFDEYSLLLDSDLGNLELKNTEKTAVTDKISLLNKIREEIIVELNQILIKNDLSPVSSVSKLLKVMNQYEIDNQKKHLQRFNLLLIDMIEKIQNQNKKNQLFINKALMSLKEIREEVMGKKDYSTYSRSGESINSHKG